MGKISPAEILDNWRQGPSLQPHTTTPCTSSADAVSEGSRRSHPSSASTPTMQRLLEPLTTLPGSSLTDIMGFVREHQPACAPTSQALADPNGSLGLGALASIAYEDCVFVPYPTALWTSTSTASIIPQPVYLSEPVQPWSYESVVAG